MAIINRDVVAIHLEGDDVDVKWKDHWVVPTMRIGGIECVELGPHNTQFKKMMSGNIDMVESLRLRRNSTIGELMQALEDDADDGGDASDVVGPKNQGGNRRRRKREAVDDLPKWVHVILYADDDTSHTIRVKTDFNNAAHIVIELTQENLMFLKKTPSMTAVDFIPKNEFANVQYSPCLRSAHFKYKHNGKTKYKRMKLSADAKDVDAMQKEFERVAEILHVLYEKYTQNSSAGSQDAEPSV